MAAVEDLEPGVRDPLGQEFAVGEWRKVVVPARADECRRVDRAEFVDDVVAGSCRQLPAQSGGRLGRERSLRLRGHLLVERAEAGYRLVGVGIPPTVGDPHPDGEGLVVVLGREVVQRIRGMGTAR